MAGTKENDADDLVHSILEILRKSRTDYTVFFRTLSNYSLSSPSTTKGAISDLILTSFASKSYKNAFRRRDPKEVAPTAESIGAELETWFGAYHNRVLEAVGGDTGLEALEEADRKRKAAMWAANPKWVPRQWIMQDIIETCSQSPICEVSKTASLSQDSMVDDSDLPDAPADPDNHIGIVDRAMRVLLGDTFGEISDAEEWEKLLGKKKEANVFAEGWGVQEWMLVEKWANEPTVGCEVLVLMFRRIWTDFNALHRK